MAMHQNGCLTPKGREAMARSVIGGGLSKAAAARRFNTTPKTVAKMGRAFPRRGRGRLAGPFIEARSSPSQTEPAVCAAVEAL